MAVNTHIKMKKPVLILSLIMIILVGSILANAQNEAQAEAKQSWFGSFISFFKSFFAKVFNSETNKPISIVNTSEGKGIKEAVTDEQKAGIANITNITCGDCQYATNNTCFNYTCCKDEECNSDEICSGHSCEALNCSLCQYAENHSCINYECCKDEDCGTGKICVFNKCTKKEQLSVPYNLTYEKLIQIGVTGGPKIIGYNFTDTIAHLSLPIDYSMGGEGASLLFAIIRTKEDFDYIQSNIVPVPIDYEGGYENLVSSIDFKNYFLILFSGSLGNNEYFFITKEVVVETPNKILIVFERSDSGRETRSDAQTLLMIKKSDLIQRNNLDFIFINANNRSLTWTIPSVNIT